ncbi:MAG: NlpC/P60 family protein [Chloroflexia bacterium]
MNDGPELYGGVCVSVTDLRAEPDAASELLNQALLATPLTVLEKHADSQDRLWLLVRLPDYEGWMLADHMVRTGPPDPQANYMYIQALSTPLRILGPNRSPGEETITAYMGTRLRVAPLAVQGAGPIVLELPSGVLAAAEPSSLRPADPLCRGEADSAIYTARQFQGTPYLWGGMTREGIDCSGLVQISYRLHGRHLPRDADQQFKALPLEVAQADLRPGDLIFYGQRREQVTHVMLYFDSGRVIHASGAAGRVVVQSLDPADPDYHERTDEYIGARRVVPSGSGENSDGL